MSNEDAQSRGVTIGPKEIERLKTLAESKAWSDREDFVVDDWACGNVDDAFYGGQDAGEILLARELLDSLSVPYEIKK